MKCNDMKDIERYTKMKRMSYTLKFQRKIPQDFVSCGSPRADGQRRNPVTQSFQRSADVASHMFEITHNFLPSSNISRNFISICQNTPYFRKESKLSLMRIASFSLIQLHISSRPSPVFELTGKITAFGLRSRILFLAFSKSKSK